MASSYGVDVERALDLLAGRNGAQLAPIEAVVLLEKAARAGSAEAAARAAVVAAAGFGRPQSWPQALDWLAVAAARGHRDARAQLALLAGLPAGNDAHGCDWTDVRQRIDHRAWIASRPARLVNKSPRIGIAPGFLTPELCAWLIERARPLEEQALVYDHAAGAGVAHDSRTNSVATFTICELDVPMLLLRARIANTLNAPVLFLERFSVFHYRVGQRFAPHVDYVDPERFPEDIAQNGQRAATFLVYLNENFEGGETHFLRIAKRLRGRTGDALFFYNLDEAGNPDRMSLHEGSAPTSGEKWLLSQFIRNKNIGQG